MSLTPKEQLEQVNNPNLLSILSKIQGLPTQESLISGAYGMAIVKGIIKTP